MYSRFGYKTIKFSRVYEYVIIISMFRLYLGLVILQFILNEKWNSVLLMLATEPCILNRKIGIWKYYENLCYLHIYTCNMSALNDL